MKRQLSFRQRQFLTLLILAVVPLIFTLGMALPFIQNFVIQSTRVQLEIVADLKTTEVNNWIDGGRDVAILISKRVVHEIEDNSISSDAFQNPDDLPLLQHHFTNLLESTQDIFNEIASISILHPDNGDILLSTDSSLIGRKRRDEDFFTFGREDLYISPVVYSVGRETPVLTITIPIKDDGNKLLAIVEIEMNLTDLNSILESRTGLGETGHAYLIEGYGFYVTQAPHQSNSVLRTIAESDGVDKVLAGEEGYGSYLDSFGEAVLGVYRWLPQASLGLLVEIDQAEMTAQYQYIWVLLIIAELVLLSIAIMIARVLANRLVQPLERIVAVTHSLHAGNLNQRAVAEGTEEIHQLALAFNEMAIRLQASYENLEGQVQERTEELTHTNVQLRQEIDEREQIQQALETSEARLEEAQSIAHLGNWEWDIITNKLDWSDEVYRISGFDPQHYDPNLSSFNELIHHDDRDWVQEALNKALKGQPYSLDYRCIRPTGEVYYIHSEGKVMFDDQGQPIHMVGVVQDITKRKLVEEEIRKLNTELEDRVQHRTAELENANRELSAFAYSVSHDLRAPLRAITGFSQAVLEDYEDLLDDEGRDFLNEIVKAGKRMNDLIQDLLHLSRITRSELSRSQVNVSDIVQSVLDGLQNQDSQRQVTVSVEANIRADADERLLHAVFDNLLGNAWKFTGKTDDAQIEFFTTTKDNETVYVVKDNGAGFDMAYADKLFGAFQRLHHADEFEGTGIGLATVQRVIHKHGGRIWADAVMKQGATFYFTLSPRSSTSSYIDERKPHDIIDY